MPLTCEYECLLLQSLKEIGLHHEVDTNYIFSHTVCPNCSNALTISRAEPSARYPLGVNRFECRTCPYQYVLDRAFFEKTPMKQKEVEDVFGGKEEFANADTIASEFFTTICLGTEAVTYMIFPRFSSMSCRRLQRRSCILLPTADSKCRRAYDYFPQGAFPPSWL